MGNVIGRAIIEVNEDLKKKIKKRPRSDMVCIVWKLRSLGVHVLTQ